MIISIASTKGGVGKSVTALQIATYLLTQEGKKVFLIDADAQRTSYLSTYIRGQRIDAFPKLPSEVILGGEEVYKAALEKSKEYDYVVIDVGVSGPGVVKKALDRLIEQKDAGRRITVDDVAETIKYTAFKVTRVGEIIGRDVANMLGIPFGVADLSLAPTPAVGDSVGEIFQALGLSSIGAPGTTAILAMLNDAVKKGGVFASSHVGGLSGAFIPVSEDAAIEAAARSGALTMEKLEAMTSVCSVGLDMIAIPGSTPASTIAGIIADEAAIGMINSKATAVRVIPVPGKDVGDKAVFGGLLGEAAVIRVPGGESSKFMSLGGRIPAPIHSLRN